MPALVLVLTPVGHVEYVNPYFEAVSGYALADVRGRDAFTLFVRERERERMRSLFADAIAAGDRSADVCPIVTRAGEVRVIDWSARALVGDDGVSRGLIAYGRDITAERRELRARLELEQAAVAREEAQQRRVQTLLQSFLDAFPGFAALYSPDGRLVLANQRTRELSHRAAGDDRPVWERGVPGISARDLERFAAVLRRLAAGGDQQIFEVTAGGRVLEVTMASVVGAADEGITHIAAFAFDVTERSEAMHEVARSEARLRESQSLAALGTWELDLRSGELRWSDEIYRLFEIEPADFGASYEAFLARVHPDDRDEVDRAYKRSLSERTEYAITHRLLLPRGRIRYVSERCRTIYSADGEPLRSLGTVQDISWHLEVTARLRRILDNMFAFVGIFDVSGRLVEVNRAPLNLIDARREDVVGKPLWETRWWSYSAESRAKAREVLARAARGEVVRGDFRVRTSDGYITIDAMFGPLRGEGGEIEGAIASAVDISERKRAESAAHRSSELLRAVVQSAPTMLFAIELDGTISLSEGSALATIGVAPGEQVGRSVHDLYGEEHVFLDGLERALAGEEVRFPASGGGLCFDIFLAPRRDHAGAIDGVVGVAIDVTRRQEQETRIAAQLAEKEVLLREIHHRVKNNLQVIASLLHFQAKRARSPEDAAAFVEGRERVFAMILVHEKLYESADLSQVELGDYVRALAAALVASQPARPQVAVAIDAERVRLPIEYALPSGMILAELLTNAFKYAFPGERAGRIDVRIRWRDGHVVLEVEDDGVGVDDADALLAGSGFGLRLVRTLTLQLDGELTAARAEETGVKVRVAFFVGECEPPGAA